MTREEAINELNFYRNQHYADSMTQESRILADAINEILPHYAALREQEERSKGCLYCDGTEGDLYFHEGACSQMNDVVYISGNQINCDFGCKAWASFDIKFCPVCGRKLEVEG